MFRTIERFFARRHHNRVMAERRAQRLANRPRGQQEIKTRAQAAQASELFEQQRKFRNPIPGERSIMGRAVRIELDGKWLATAVGAAYTLGADGQSGGGRLRVDKVNSRWEALMATEETRRGHTLVISYEDAAMPNPEVIELRDVEFQSLTGGYDITEIVFQDVFFTFDAWELKQAVTETLQADVWEAAAT